CFASAGNTALRHWSGRFRDGGSGFHEWRPGLVDNVLKPFGDERVSVELYWPPGTAYDLFVYEKATGREVGRCLGPGDRNACCAVVQFVPLPGRTYRLRVRQARGTGGPFHLVALGGSL